MRIAMKKAIATHMVVLVIMMGLFAIVALFLFYKWADITNIEANTATCTFKRSLYCTDWSVNNNYGTEPWNWDDKPPIGCERFEITKPENKDDCKGLT